MSEGEPIDLDDHDSQFDDDFGQGLGGAIEAERNAGGLDEDDDDDDDDDELDDDDEFGDDDIAPDGVVQALGLLLAGSANVHIADAGVGTTLHALLQQLNAAAPSAAGGAPMMQALDAQASAGGSSTTTGQPSPAPRLVDALTGVPVAPSAAAIQLFGAAFDAVQLAEYFASTRDLRDPLTGAAATSSDLRALAEAVRMSNPGLATRLLATTQREALPASTRTSRSQYFQDTAHVVAIQLLAICELEAIDSLAAVQETYATMWPAFVRAMCGLANSDPLRAATVAVSIRELTSQAYSEAIREDATVFVHEPSVLQPVASSVFSVCTAAVSGALFAANSAQMVARLAGIPGLPVHG